MERLEGLYFSAKVPRDCAPGVYAGNLNVRIGDAALKIPVEFTVHKAILQYLGALGKVLRQGGWTDMFYLSIADEPNVPNAVEYRALCGMARHLLPGVKLFDAMSHGPFYVQGQAAQQATAQRQ